MSLFLTLKIIKEPQDPSNYSSVAHPGIEFEKEIGLLLDKFNIKYDYNYRGPYDFLFSLKDSKYLIEAKLSVHTLSTNAFKYILKRFQDLVNKMQVNEGYTR